MSPVSSSARPETPLMEDHLLSQTMLPSTGEGENIMKIFIQEHMTSILQPLAETVQEIQRSIKHIKEGTAVANVLAERNQEHIAAHEQKLVMYGAGLSRVNEDIVGQKNEIQEVLDRQVNIEGENDVTKVSLSKIEGFVQATANAGQDLRKTVDEIDSRLRETQLSLSETTVNHMAFADRLSEIRNLHDGLNDRHLQLMSSMQQVRQSDENTRSMLKRHVATFDKQKKDVQRSFALIEDRLKSAEAMLLDTSHKAHSNTKTLKTMSNDLRKVLGEMGEMSDMQHMGAKTDSHNPEATQKVVQKQETPAERFQGRIGRIEEGIAQLQRTIQIEKDTGAGHRKDLDEFVKKAVSEVRENSLHIELLNKNTKSHEEKILRSETKLTQHESNIDKVAKRVEKVDSDARLLSVNLQEISGALDIAQSERERMNVTVQATSKEVDAVTTDVNTLNKDVVEMQGSMAKIGMRLELAHEYFQGMSKGFQDTHKRVTAGLDGMVAPKTVANRKMLPEIPGSKSPSPGP